MILYPRSCEKQVELTGGAPSGYKEKHREEIPGVSPLKGGGVYEIEECVV